MYCLISSPMLLIVIAVSGIAAHTAARRTKDRKLSVAGEEESNSELLSGHEITLAHQFGAIIVCALPFLFLAGAGAVLFWVLGASLFTVTVHAAFYNYDKLEGTGDEEHLIGAIVEEV